MWDMLSAVFWFGLGMLSLAGVLARAGAIAGRLNEGNMRDGV